MKYATQENMNKSNNYNRNKSNNYHKNEGSNYYKNEGSNYRKNEGSNYHKNNNNNSSKYKDNSYIPEVLTGGAIAGLAVAGLVNGKASTAQDVFGGLKNGATSGGLKAFKNSKVGGKLKPYIGLGKKVKGKTSRNFKDFDNFVTKYKKSNNYRPGHRFSPESEKLLYRKMQQEDAELKRFAEKAEQKWREISGFDPKARLNDINVKDLKTYMDDQWSGAVKATPGKDWLYKNPSDVLESNKKKKKNFAGNIADGVGLGVGGGVTSLGIHALGEKYFDKQDDDKVRKIVQGSYRKDNKRETPNQRASQYNRGNQPFKKFAALNTDYISDVIKGVNGKEALINAGEVSAAGIADAALIGGIPLAILKASGRDIRNGWKKVDGEPGDDNNIVIDVPLSALKKKASMEESVSDVAETIAKDDRLAKFLSKRKDTAIRVLPWTTTAGLIAGASAGSGSKLPPLTEGNARITIQTRPKERASDDMLMRSASEVSARDNDTSDDVEELMKEIRRSINASYSDDKDKGLLKSMNYKPRSGEVGKNYKFRKES